MTLIAAQCDMSPEDGQIDRRRAQVLMLPIVAMTLSVPLRASRKNVPELNDAAANYKLPLLTADRRNRRRRRRRAGELVAEVLGSAISSPSVQQPPSS